MKRNLKLVGFYTVAFFGLMTAPFGQPKVPVSTKEFMREKLDHSQKLLAALATEDYFTKDSFNRISTELCRGPNWAGHRTMVRDFKAPRSVDVCGGFYCVCRFEPRPGAVCGRPGVAEQIVAAA
jgi:hypothetical protein